MAGSGITTKNILVVSKNIRLILKGDVMAELNWEGNTKEIFDVSTGLTPGPFRKKAQQMMMEAIIKRVGEGGTVTEEVVVECMKETTPKPFVPIGLKKIRHLLSKDY